MAFELISSSQRMMGNKECVKVSKTQLRFSPVLWSKNPEQFELKYAILLVDRLERKFKIVLSADDSPSAFMVQGGDGKGSFLTSQKFMPLLGPGEKNAIWADKYTIIGEF